MASPTTEREVVPMTGATAVIYLRVSSASQITGRDADGLSIKAQREACLKKARDLGVEVVEQYVDKAESARSSRRPALQQMLSDMQKRPVGYVIVHKLDRLARNRGDDVAINLALQQAGAKLISCSENIDDSPSGMLLHGIMSTIAEFYSLNLAAEIQKGVHQKLKAGGTPKPAPLGYLNVRERSEDGREVRTIAVDPERAPLVRWAFERYATGEESLKSLQLQLNERGLRTRATPKRPAKEITVSTLQYMLRNPYYIGIVRWKEAEYEGTHEHLVDKDTFARVQEVLDTHRRGRSGTKVWKHKHYLRGMLTCGHCGSSMGFTRANGRSATYDYFFCVGRANAKNGCQQPYTPAELIEQHVEESYRDIRLDAGAVEKLKTLIAEGFKALQQTDQDNLELQRRRLQKIERQQKKLLDLHYEELIEPELFKAEQKRLRAEKADAQSQLQAATTAVDVLVDQATAALEQLRDCYDAYQAAKPTQRRTLDAAIYDGFIIYNDQLKEAEPSEVTAALTSPDLITTLEREVEELQSAQNLDAAEDTQTAVSVTTHATPPPITSTHSQTHTQNNKNRATFCKRRGSRIQELVDRTGLEPVTSRV